MPAVVAAETVAQSTARSRNVTRAARIVAAAQGAEERKVEPRTNPTTQQLMWFLCSELLNRFCDQFWVLKR